MKFSLLQGDCLELMRDIPDGSVDMVLADPPCSSGGLFAGDRKADTRTKYTDSDYSGAVPEFQRGQYGPAELYGIYAHGAEQMPPKGKTGKRCRCVCELAKFIRHDGCPTNSWLGMARRMRLEQRERPQYPRAVPAGLRVRCLGDKGADWTPGFAALPGLYDVKSVSTDRNFIGMELDPGYFETAKRRIEEAGTYVRQQEG